MGHAINFDAIALIVIAKLVDIVLLLRYNRDTMHIITRGRLLEFIATHPNAEAGLEHWYRIMKHTNFGSLVEARQVFPHADPVGRLTVFNIGGNHYRLIVAIHYNRGRVYIRHVLTHAEYDRGKWKE